MNDQSKLKGAERAQYIEGIVMSLINAGIYPSRRKISGIIRGRGLSLANDRHLKVYRLTGDRLARDATF